MGTRGVFGVIVGEKAKIGYNQYDSYPEGKGVANLRWLRETIAEGQLDHYRELGEKCRLVDDSVKITTKDRKALASTTDANVSTGDDWYALTRETHGSFEDMLGCGYIVDFDDFALESLFCEWGYIVDFDAEVFEVYEGFQKSLPTLGRWAGRPTAEEDTESYIAHLEWCLKNGREPFRGRESEYKAIQRVAAYPFAHIPELTDDQFIKDNHAFEEEEALV